jgi:uncharacterized protein with GYD domain
MPTFITLSRLTDEGIKTDRESPFHLYAFKRAIEEHGCKLRGMYFTLGSYDAILIIESPSDEVMYTLALTIGSQGVVRTETLRVLSEAEYHEIVDKIT